MTSKPGEQRAVDLSRRVPGDFVASTASSPAPPAARSRLNALRLRRALASVAAGFACFSCATMQEHKTSTPYQQEELLQHSVLGGRRATQFFGRVDGSRVLVRLEDIEVCQDDFYLHKGMRVTTHRSVPPDTAGKLWITFGSTAATTALLAVVNANTECSKEESVCVGKGAAYVGMVAMAAVTAVAGGVLVGNYVAATDSTESFEQPPKRQHRIQVCLRAARPGAHIEATVGGVRNIATTDSRGEAVLGLGLPSRGEGETRVQVVLDGSPLGVVPLTSTWRTALLRR